VLPRDHRVPVRDRDHAMVGSHDRFAVFRLAWAGLQPAPRVSFRSARRLAMLAGAAVLVAGGDRSGAAEVGRLAPPICLGTGASGAYMSSTLDALRAQTDVWGNRLLAAPGGPTYAAARRYLKPLLLARGAGGKPLTASGVYYLPFAQPDGPSGAGSVALHVADGSQIVSQHVGGRTLTVSVGGRGGERFGSCLARLATPALSGGYLPILETRYVDAGGARYRQESFVARLPATRPLVSFVRITVDARRARTAVRLRLTPSVSGLHRVGNALLQEDGGFVLVYSDGGHFDGSSVTFAAQRGTTRTVYAAWLNSSGPAALRTVTAATYVAARRSAVSYWRERLSEGMTISVPEPRVQNAERALLIQDLELTWRYSIGNAYEEFSFPESVDVAQTLAEQGFETVARSMLATSLTRKETPYPNWKNGERLLAVAEYYRLSADRAYLDRTTPVLRGYVAALGRQIESGGGLLGRERYSSDIPDTVYGLHSQTVAWAGLRAMANAWAQAGQPGLAATCRRLAAKLGAALKRAVRASERTLPDGSLFIPVRLLDAEKPYASLTQERLGSYWNLVMPYALASSFFAPRSRESKGVLRYMLLHGSRLLGLVRSGGYALYGKDARPPISGTDEVYGNNVARFLADNDQADQLVLTLYGDLAAGMTARTFVSGEAATIAPFDGASYRAMYLPPNGASNAAFLETLRLMLVHETTDRDGRPSGLQLGYATPRSWLHAGRRIAVSGVPTSFGPVSYSISAGSGAVRVTVDVPNRARTKELTLRLRLPRGERISGVTLAGRAVHRFDAASATLDLSGLSGSLELVAHLSRTRVSP
jgi:hypothetical protein